MSVAVTLQAVHGLQSVQDDELRVVGLGVCAAPIQQRDMRKPPMVVLLQDTQSVHEGDGHNRQAEIDGDTSAFICALDWKPAQELSGVLETMATQIRKRDEWGSNIPTEPRLFQCFLVDTMTMSYLVVDLRQVRNADHVVNAASITVARRQVALLGENACVHLATQLAQKSRKVRTALGASA
jgi:hypothetical protein